MSDNELEEYLKTIEPNFESHIEKGTIEMSNEYYNLFEERMIRVLNENKQLKEDKKKAINYIDIYIKIIKEQPNADLGNDKWIIERLNSIKHILLGENENE